MWINFFFFFLFCVLQQDIPAYMGFFDIFDHNYQALLGL